jgi:competence protein ComEA
VHLRPAVSGSVAQLSRSQLLVYAAAAIALLLLGARWIRSQDAEGAQASGVSSIEGGESVSFESGGGGGLVVHVAGEVREPGVLRLPAGSRVTDAVERAGGATETASLDTLNLAAELADGQQVVVPGDAAAAGTAADPAAVEGPISVGTATVEQLDTIEGIGPVTAQNIVDFRTENGGVSSVEELDQISGIGPATMEALRSSLQP